MSDFKSRFNHYFGNYVPIPDVRQPDTKSTEPLVGFRVWRTQRDGGVLKLRSVVHDTIWPLRKPLEKDFVPASDLGIHATKKFAAQLISDYQYFDVAGEVYLWGRVEEFELGYTAEFAYPKRLWYRPDIDPLTVMELEEGYGVSGEIHEELPQRPREDTLSLGSLSLAYQHIGAQQQQLQAYYAQAFTIPSNGIYVSGQGGLYAQLTNVTPVPFSGQILGGFGSGISSLLPSSPAPSTSTSQYPPATEVSE
jgi:hypothetical protein